jgi:Ca2+-transporting ATPase
LFAIKFYSLTAEEAAQELASSRELGLPESEAALRLQKFGTNQLKEKKSRGPLSIFLEQFEDFIIWVLIVAALVSGVLREWIDAAAIVAIVFLNAILGFIQGYRAERALAALKKLASPTSKVIRAGQHLVIPSSHIVPGDLIELEAGDNIPADARLVYATANFSTAEASLTGESVPVAKTILKLEEKEPPLAERANMVYAGTAVASGKARALVAETGMRTELGRIAGMIQEIESATTPLQKKLEEFGKRIVYVCLVLVAVVFLLQAWRSGDLLETFITAVSLAVAAIPEGLPAVVTIALALGVQRMVKRHALIRKLPSVETLGSATVICSDKTGTLTKNEMTVQAVYAGKKLFKVSGVGYEPQGEYWLEGKAVQLHDHPELGKALRCGVLCNGAELAGNKIIGDPTEGAILTAAAKLGLRKDKLEAEYSFVEEIPFDSERKKMTIIRRQGGKYFAFVKGAPDVLLDNCTEIDKAAVLKMNSLLASQALRVLAVAYKILDEAPQKYEAESIEKDLSFLGLIGMIDPPREEVKAAIKNCQRAGIKTVMITGDHKNTAVAIARELGLFQVNSLALSGEELGQISEAELYNRAERISVYARVSPEHKLRIVRALRRNGEIVAMTGDGVNDAPAVKEADIGVAMGITGTDVTKEVSDMVITDDNFASIVAAVEEGRGIYDNIKKFVHYLLSCNVGEILVMFIASLIGWPIPLMPIQILWVNLVTDSLPALALGMDPVDPAIMEKPPRPPNQPVITAGRGWLMLGQGSFIAFCSLLAFGFILFVERGSIERARTAAFIVLSCSQLFHSFNCRNMRESLFTIGVFSNNNLILANGISFLLQMAAVYLPFFQTIFKTEPLGLSDWFLVVGISSFPFWATEIMKWANKRMRFLPAD